MAEDMSDKLGDKVADKVRGKVADKVADKLADRVGDRVADKVAGQIGDKVADKAVSDDKVADKIADKVADKVADRVADKVASRVSDQQGDKIADKVADKMNKPPADQHSPANEQRPAKKHHWGIVIVILLVVVAGLVVFRLFGEKKPKPMVPPPVSVTVTNVGKGDIEVAVTSLGAVQPVYTASMSPRVDGQLISVNFVEGQMVASNELLAVIDPGPYQAALTETQGQLQRDKALMEGHKVDLKRFQDAYAKQAVPKQQVDDQVALVHQDEGTVKYDEGQVENAQVQLNYAYIRAPFAGRVGLREIDPGNVVHAANTNAMVVVAQLQPITLVFNVAEDYLPQIQEQMQARHEDPVPSISDSNHELQEQPSGTHPMAVEAWDRADENKIAGGKVLALNNLIDSATGTVRIKAIFENTNLTLFPNQFVNAKLIIKTIHDATLVPTFAIQHNPDGAFVYLMQNTNVTTNGVSTNYTVATMRAIVPGTVDGNTTAITEGLEPGEVIALDNFNKLGEGVKVAPRRGDQPQGGGSGKHEGGSYGKKSAAASSDSDSKESP